MIRVRRCVDCDHWARMPSGRAQGHAWGACTDPASLLYHGHHPQGAGAPVVRDDDSCHCFKPIPEATGYDKRARPVRT